MGREIIFRPYKREEIQIKEGCKGEYKQSGYVMVKAPYHPHANKRGYVPLHRLVIENQLGRYLVPRSELVHHIDGDRSNNDLSNLKLTTTSKHFIEEHFKGRNKNGQFVAQEPIFSEIKFRLYDKDNNLTSIFTLKELISKTFRKSKFEFRGRFTGLKDWNGKEIYEGDILHHPVQGTRKVYYPFSERVAGYGLEEINSGFKSDLSDSFLYKIVGNIYEGVEE